MGSRCIQTRSLTSGGRAVAAGLACGALLLAGCAGEGGASRFSGVTLHDEALVVRGVAPILQTPDVPCGPACLASVAAYWDRPVTASGVREALGDAAGADAHSAEELAGAARAMGLEAYAYQGSLEDLDANLEHGRPVIVLIRRRPLGEVGELGMDGSVVERVASRLSAKHTHWIVIVGSDKDSVIAHDPAVGAVRVSRGVFDSWWTDTARMSLLVVPEEAAAAAPPVGSSEDRDK